MVHTAMRTTTADEHGPYLNERGDTDSEGDGGGCEGGGGEDGGGGGGAHAEDGDDPRVRDPVTRRRSHPM